jgi:hypothetical protein
MGALEGVARGFNQFSQNALNTTMKLAEFQEQSKRRAVEQDHIDRQNKLIDMKTKEFERDRELMPIEETLSQIGITSPEEHALVLKNMNPMEIENVGGTNYIQRQNAKQFWGTKQSDPNFNIGLGEIRTSNADKGIKQIDAQLQNPESKLKPEQIDALQKQRVALVEQRTQLANAIKKEQARLTTENMKVVGGTAIDPTQTDEEGNPKVLFDGRKAESREVGASGWGTYDKKTGKPIWLKPEKSSGGGTQPKGGGSGKPVQDEIKRLKEFRKTHENNLGDEGLKKVDALISGVMNGTVKPGTVVYPDVVEDGRLVHGAKGKALQGAESKKDKFGYVIGEQKNGYKYIGNDQWQKL